MGGGAVGGRGRPRDSRGIPSFLSEHTWFYQINFCVNIQQVDGREEEEEEAAVAASVTRCGEILFIGATF